MQPRDTRSSAPTCPGQAHRKRSKVKRIREGGGGLFLPPGLTIPGIFSSVGVTFASAHCRLVELSIPCRCSLSKYTRPLFSLIISSHIFLLFFILFFFSFLFSPLFSRPFIPFCLLPPLFPRFSSRLSYAYSLSSPFCLFLYHIFHLSSLISYFLKILSFPPPFLPRDCPRLALHHTQGTLSSSLHSLNFSSFSYSSSSSSLPFLLLNSPFLTFSVNHTYYLYFCDDSLLCLEHFL